MQSLSSYLQPTFNYLCPMSHGLDDDNKALELWPSLSLEVGRNSLVNIRMWRLLMLWSWPNAPLKIYDNCLNKEEKENSSIPTTSFGSIQWLEWIWRNVAIGFFIILETLHNLGWRSFRSVFVELKKKDKFGSLRHAWYGGQCR